MKPSFAMHSYPWYIADWKNSETRIALTMAERGLYRELLDHCYTEGSIPDDERKLAGIAACPINELRKLWPQVKQCFSCNGEPGRLQHKRVNEVLYKLESWNESRRKGGQQRQQKRLALASEYSALPECKVDSFTTALADTPVSGTSSSSSSSSTTKREPSTFELKLKETFAEMLRRHKVRPCSVADGERLLHKITLTVPANERIKLLDEINARHTRWCESEDWNHDGCRFWKGLAPWLNRDKELWKQEPLSVMQLQLKPTNSAPANWGGTNYPLPAGFRRD